jgi:3-oxoacyl-[acyl-carrier-protein] synthase III
MIDEPRPRKTKKNPPSTMYKLGSKIKDRATGRKELVWAGITGLGSFVPVKKLTNDDLAKKVDTTDEWIVARTGIKERRIAAKGVNPSDLAVKAARKALKSAGREATDVDLIIVTSASPDQPWPSTACLVQAKLGAVNASAFDLQAACAGFVYAMTVGSQFIETRRAKCVLVIGAETMSRLVDWTDRTTCVLFGDAAGAVVLERVEFGYGFMASCTGADGTGASLLEVPAGGSAMPASAETVANNMHYIKMNGNEVYKFAARVSIDAATKALKQAGLHREDIDYFIPHQANARITEAAAKRLKIPVEKVVSNIEKYGNTSTASIPLALDELWQSGRLKYGNILLMVGFGAGLTWGANVIRWTKKEA